MVDFEIGSKVKIIKDEQNPDNLDKIVIITGFVEEMIPVLLVSDKASSTGYSKYKMWLVEGDITAFADENGPFEGLIISQDGYIGNGTYRSEEIAALILH